ncbi:pseudouridine synthase [Hymenobacter negativus]|uniref:Pseudouridine synthase n=1 Tax=Hymenobacter negativus TaxID=2795026 RepID=A0ABS3QHK7_9BACT|nr:pseudouridine synthase [Hymenobacter negativus]MBO2010742.1 pseudouridine synthase [Hymenobacter negativus]
MSHRYFAVHKPYGYLSQFGGPSSGEVKKPLLGELHDFPAGTMATDQLEEETEGLLLLTTNNQIGDLIRSYKTAQEYHVLVDGLIDAAAIARLQTGVESEAYPTSSCLARRLDAGPYFPPCARNVGDGPTSWVSITITEGNCRQVRKMTAAVGFPTLRLLRERIGGIHLGNMQPGWVVESDDFVFWPNNEISARTYMPDFRG